LLMRDIGNFLKENRERKGISLSKAEEEIKIRKKYLQALEEGNFDLIPGKAYTLGYLKNYSKYLGLDDEVINGILQAYKDYTQKSNGILLPAKEKNVSFKRKEKEEKSTSLGKKKTVSPYKYVYLISFLLIILVGLWWLNYSLKEAQNIPIPTPQIESETERRPTESKNNEASTLSLENNKVEEVYPHLGEAPVEETLLSEDIAISKLPSLRIVATNNTWIKVLSNDQPIFEGILFEGEEMVWRSDQSLDLVTEYPAQIEAYYNENKIEIKEGMTRNNILKYSFTPR